jgi:uncharacterized RmlC-like cupin family protein
MPQRSASDGSKRQAGHHPEGQESSNTSQSGGMAPVTGVGPQHTSATRLWFGKASNAPGFRSLPHHHGEAETGAYLLSGNARIYFGENYQEFVELSAGDFMFAPITMHMKASSPGENPNNLIPGEPTT